MNNKKIISIIGMMAVGKTTIGSKLATKLGYYFIDSDKEIEDKTHKTIKEIFTEYGEKYFRKIEEEVITEILNREEKIVLSLGGGAFINDEVRKKVKEKSIVIWLEASIDEIVKRVKRKNDRPLLNSPNKKEIIQNLIKERYPFYCQSDLKFDTSKNNHTLLISQIIKGINSLENAK